VRRATLEELKEAPVGRWIGGPTFVHFCATPTLWGLIFWGRPEPEHAMELGRSLVVELRPPAVRHASIIDASRLEGADPQAFHAAQRYVEHNAERLSTWVTRVALVRPGGMGGAIVAGAYEVLPRPHPVAVFHQAADALAWLADGRDTDWPGPGLLAELHAQASGTPELLGALRLYLDRHLDAELAASARALGVSERTLQRKLGEAATTFTDELGAARVRVAQRMLIEGEAPLTSIAYDVGCASLQHFSALFRKRTGESPSAFRARHRRS
jgi:AraC-like DNA-binding protein